MDKRKYQVLKIPVGITYVRWQGETISRLEMALNMMAQGYEKELREGVFGDYVGIALGFLNFIKELVNEESADGVY